MTSSRNVVVCDNGLGFVKCGLAGDNFHTAVLTCMAGRPLLRYEESLGDQELQDIVIGEACSQPQRQLKVAYPITNGLVHNQDDTAHIWDRTFFNRLYIDPLETKILPTDLPLNQKRNHEKMLQQFCWGVHSNTSCSNFVCTRFTEKNWQLAHSENFRHNLAIDCQFRTLESKPVNNPSRTIVRPDFSLESCIPSLIYPPSLTESCQNNLVILKIEEVHPSEREEGPHAFASGDRRI